MQPQRQQQPPPQRERRSMLGAVTTGRIERPIRVMMFGTEGVGKSTFAANAPAPIFLGAEDGTSELDVTRLPELRCWNDALDAVHELTTARHDYKTLVIDTLDWLEPLCWEHVCKEGGEASIEGFGYGKGYTAALDQWRVFLAALERMRNAKSMHVIALAHSWIKPFKNPEGDDFDRYELKLHAKAGGLIKEWCDAVLFARFETFTDKDGKTKRVRGVSSGARVIHTTRTAAYDAKNRYDLPDTMPLDWNAFAEAVKSAAPADAKTLLARIEKLLEAVTDEALKATVRETVSNANGNASALNKIADRLAAKINITAMEQGQ